MGQQELEVPHGWGKHGGIEGSGLVMGNEAGDSVQLGRERDDIQ